MTKFQDIRVEAMNLGYKFTETEEFAMLKQARSDCDKDEQLQAQIEELGRLQGLFDEYEDNESMRKKIRDDMITLTQEILHNEKMKAYIDAKSEFEEQLEFILTAIRAITDLDGPLQCD